MKPIVTAVKLIEHRRAYGLIGAFSPPEAVLVCYQQSTMKYLLQKYPAFQPSQGVSHFFIDGRMGILGDWGVGAPGLAIKVEELIALGCKRFIAVGTAGSLMNRHAIGDFILCESALAEDGVAHHYLPKGQSTVDADPQLLKEWADFAKEPFSSAMAWSFSALFKESFEHMDRVSKLNCSVVEMETATLYAIGQEKNVQTLSLFVISDSLSQEAWTPKIKDPLVINHLHQLADSVLAFSCLDFKSIFS